MLNSSLKNSVFVHFCYVRTLCSRTESYRDPSAWAWFSLYGGWYVSTLCLILPSPVDYSVLWLALKYNDVECDSLNGVPVLLKDSRHILAVMEILAKWNLLVLDSLLMHALINSHIYQTYWKSISLYCVFSGLPCKFNVRYNYQEHVNRHAWSILNIVSYYACIISLSFVPNSLVMSIGILRFRKPNHYSRWPVKYVKFGVIDCRTMKEISESPGKG